MKPSDVKICCVESHGKQPKILQDFSETFFLCFCWCLKPRKWKGGIKLRNMFSEEWPQPLWSTTNQLSWLRICFNLHLRNCLMERDLADLADFQFFFGRPVEAHIVCWNPGTNFVLFCFARYEQSRSLHATMWVAMVNSTWGNCGGDGVVQAVEQVMGWMKVVGFPHHVRLEAFWKMIFLPVP